MLSDVERQYKSFCDAYGVKPDAAVLSTLRTRSKTIKPGHAYTEEELLPLVDLLSTAKQLLSPQSSPQITPPTGDEESGAAGSGIPLLEMGKEKKEKKEKTPEMDSEEAREATMKKRAKSRLEDEMREKTDGPSISWVTRLDLSGGKFGSNGAVLLCHVLRENTTLKDVNLSNCRIGPRGFDAVAGVIARNGTIERLDLHGNLCYRDRAELIARALSLGAHRLVRLDLSNTALSWRGVSAIAAAVQKCNKERQALPIQPQPALEFIDHGNLIREEVWNSVTHGIGALFSLVGGVVMLIAHRHKSWDRLACAGAFLISINLVYFSSLFYHSFFQIKGAMHVFRRLDHAAVYLLIAGTYTPWAVLAFRGTMGFILFGIEWVGVTIGILLDVFAWLRYERLKLALYVCLGWACVIVFVPALTHPHLTVATAGFVWLAVGGVIYSGGVYFFVNDKNPSNHIIWHCFTLVASFCHYVAIYNYVLDAPYPVPPFDQFWFSELKSSSSVAAP